MISYIIVDDETASHEVIKGYANNLPFLSYQKSCYNAFEAINHLNAHKVDLIFLDIHMPKLSGLEFLKALAQQPKVIITSAHKDYALEGYDLNITDYLLKPFSFSRFVQAVTKLQETIPSAPILSGYQSSESSDTIFIKEDKRYHQIKLRDILYIEAYGNYVKIHLIDKMIVSHQTLVSLTQSLPRQLFMRVHKSFIVATDKINLIEGNRIHIQNHTIPIGKMYKANVNRMLEEN